MVLADSHEISRAPCYSGTRPTRAAGISPTGVSPSPPALPRTFDYPNGHARRSGRNDNRRSHNPAPATPAEYYHGNGLATIRFRSPLLTESLLFSSPAGTEMFHFPAFPPPALYIQAGVTAHDCCRVPPFGHPRINARLTAPRGLSQPPTSFIGS